MHEKKIVCTNINFKLINVLPVDLLFKKNSILLVVKNLNNWINLNEIINKNETIAYDTIN